VIVHPARIESLDPSTSGIIADGITARALAPMSVTVNMAKPWLLAGAIGIFPRGRSITKQLNILPGSAYEFKTVFSLVDATESIIRVRNVLRPLQWTASLPENTPRIAN
jgi:16S rRNA G527 N7-methylase RsmG